MKKIFEGDRWVGLKPWPGETKIHAVFFTRNASEDDRKCFPNPTYGKQVHGKNIITISNDSNRPTQAPEADGLVSSGGNRSVGIYTADCVPLLAFSPNLIIGACHAGWKGCEAGVVESWVKELKLLGAQPSELKIALGPSIKPCHFEVGKDVGQRLVASMPASAAPSFVKACRIKHGDPGKDFFDLNAVIIAKLDSLGITEGQI